MPCFHTSWYALSSTTHATIAPRRSLTPLKEDPRRYPHLLNSRSEFTVAQTDRHFAFGLDALTRGLESKISRRD